VRLIARYLATQYLRVFALAMAGGTGLLLTIDVFQRIGNLSRYGPSGSALGGYFFFKIPAIMTDVYPAAALLAVLVSVGQLSRNHEILALRACGLGPWRLGAPIIALSALLSLLVLAWNEVVVPPTATRYHDINDIQIKKKVSRGLFNSSSLWLQERQGYANVQYFDAHALILHGLTIYQTDPAHRLTRIIEIPRASWIYGRWGANEGSVKELGEGGAVSVRPLGADELQLTATPRDFSTRRRSARDLTYRDLRRELSMLHARGVRATGLEVDLHVKLALPFSGVVSVLLGFPLALRVGKQTGMAYALISGFALGFAYWVAMAVAVSLGQSGALSPVVAAWAANTGFALIAALLFSSAR
jgi:lipopolysaccharide export system permease protein